jgi:hypothetical protein
MRENKKFDAVFVGSSLVSLAAAVALAKRGQSVALLDRPDDLASHVPDSNFHFGVGPFLYLGFEEGGAAEGFFSELALPIPTLKKKGLSYKKNVPYLQVVQAHHRLDLHIQKEDYLDELKREFGSELQQIKTFLAAVEKEETLLYPYLGKFSQVELSGLGDRLNAWKQRLQFLQAVRNHQKKSATEFLTPFEFQPDFIEYLNLLSFFAFKKPLSKISSYDLILLISGLQKGGVRMIGGYFTLLDFFRKLIKEYGGEIIESGKVLRADLSGKKAEGLFLADGSLLSGHHLVITQAPRHPVVSFYFTVRKDWIPSPMRENILMTWGEEVPPDAEDILILQLSLPEEEKDFPAGYRGLAVTCILRSDALLEAARLEEMKARLLGRLQWLIPFSKSEIKAVPHRDRVADPFFPSDIEKSWNENAKKVSTEALAYLQPKEAKNVFLLPSDLSEHLGWGSAFLAAMTLTGLIEGSR